MTCNKMKLKMDKDYEKLARLCTIIETDFVNKESILDEFLQKNKHIINDQIPESNYFKVKNPDLIGCTPLHFAFRKQELDIFEKLLNFGANFTIKNALGETVLYQTVTEYLKDAEITKWKKTSKPYFVDLVLSALVHSKNSKNPSNNDGISHFHIACLANNTKAIELFLKAGEPINQAVNFNSSVLPGYTPLHFAARYFSVESMKILLHYGANVHSRDAKGMSPLHMLVNHNRKLVNLPQFTSNFDITYEDVDEWGNPKFKAFKELQNFNSIHFETNNIFRSKFELNKQMILLLADLNNDDHDSKVLDDIGLSNLHIACCLRDISILKRFLERNVNLKHSINTSSPIWPGYTALHFAAQFDIETVKLLLEKGANIRAKDGKGVTPLDLCLQRYDFREMSSIIGNQNNLKNIYFSDDKTKLFEFIASMHEMSSFDLFLKSMDVNSSIPYDSIIWPGYTALHLTIAFYKNNKIIDIFKPQQYDEDDYDNEEDDDHGNSTLGKNHLLNIEKCLYRGADVTAKNARGWTPLHLAFYEKKFSVANLILEKHACDVNPIDDNGISHLHIACFLKKNVEKFAAASGINSIVKSSFIAGEVENNYYYKVKDCRRGCYISAGSTPLHVLVGTANYVDFNTRKLINKLIEYGANIHDKDADGFTPVHRLFTSRVHMIDQRHSQKTFSLTDTEDCVADCGLSYLHIICSTGDVTSVERMIDLGANINRTIKCEISEKFDEMLKGDPRLFIKNYAGYTPLDFAMEGNWDRVTSILLRRGADVLMRKPDGSVLLQKFLIKSSLHQKRVFFQEYKTNDKMQNHIEEKTGLTLLHMACAALDFHVIERILNEPDRVNVNAVAHANSPVWPSFTPLHVLAMEGKRTSHGERKSVCKIIEMMIDKGANILLQNEEKKTPLHDLVDRLFSFDAYSTQEIDLISAMLKAYREDTVDSSVNPIDVSGISHLHIVCMCNDVTIVKSFLEHGVLVNHAIDFFVEEYGGCTPLHVAVAHKFPEIIRLLLDYNANVTTKNRMGESPIQTIAFRKGFEIEDLSLLIEFGANINEKNLFGETALESLIRLHENKKVYSIDDNEIIKIAVNLRCRVNVFFPHRGTGFLGRYIRHNDIRWNVRQDSDRNETVDHLVQAVIQAPDSNDADPLGRNVIHNIVSVDRSFESSTVEREYVNAIGKFIKVGFDVDHQDKRGHTPLHDAVNFKNLDGIIGLLNNGADVNIVDAKGRPAYACHSQKFIVDDDDYIDFHIHVTIQRHFNKLKLFKLHVNAANQYLIDDRPNYIEHDYYEAADRDKQLKNKVEIAKNKTIDPYSLTLNDFLCETGVVASYVFKSIFERQAINEFFQSNHAYLYENFPELMSILYLQYRKAVTRKNLIEPAITSLNILSGYDLPCLCTEVILRFLTNNELKNLIASTDDEPQNKVDILK